VYLPGQTIPVRGVVIVEQNVMEPAYPLLVTCGRVIIEMELVTDAEKIQSTVAGTLAI